MRWLIFLSRVAFLCGMFMVLAFLLLFIEWQEEVTLSSSVIMAGYGLATLMLPLTNLLYLILTLIGKKPAKWIPAWLLISNILFLIIFLIFAFYINDPYYQLQ